MTLVFWQKTCSQVLCFRMTKSEWMVGHLFLRAFVFCCVNWGSWITSHMAYV